MTSANKLPRLQVLFLSFLSSVTFPSNALAQPAADGKFKLHSETMWGTMILPAGDYTFGVEQGGALPVVMIYSITGSGKEMVLPAYVSEMGRSDIGKVTLENINGESVVTALYVEKLGLVFHYATDKTKIEMARRKSFPVTEANSYAQAK
ncbi:MAG TPA: hypothetical protein VK795_08635 [Terriglobales bacterium]|nr:hypothetical protein [Terriglobales bacterium]